MSAKQAREGGASYAPPKNERVARAPRAGAEPARAPTPTARRERITGHLKRVALFVARAVAAIAVVAGAVFLGRALETFVRTSPAFALEEVVVRGASQLSEAQVIEASGVRLGENVFEWPPEEVEARLTAHPWIDTVAVKRKLPAGFEIEVREHSPRALLVLDSLYLVSREGVVFKEVGPGERFDLPVVTLEDGAAIRADREQRARLLTEVAALLHDVEAAEPSWSTELSELHVERDGSFVLRFGDRGAEVRLGRGDFDHKLARIRRVFERLDEAGVEAQAIYADNERRPDRVTVELR